MLWKHFSRTEGIINCGVEAADLDVSAEEAVTAARWHCLLQREAEALPLGKLHGSLPGGRARCELLGAAGPFQEQKRTKDVCPFLTACHTRAGGPVQGPDRGLGMGGFVHYQPSGERPGEAPHPLLMGAFPPGGCWPVVAGGAHGGSCSAALHLSQGQPWHL